MARVGKKYPLLIYTRMMDRWWPAIFLLGLAWLGVAWPFYNNLYVRLTEPWRWMTAAGLGGGIILISFVMAAMRSSAYVQPSSDHLRLATPFLRMDVSYRRIRRSTTASMAVLFPPKTMKGLKRETIEPLLKLTAVVIELNAMPLPASTLRLFLSPFFFKDKTPHLVILVRDWMGFSTELESLRVSGNEPAAKGEQSSQSILARLPKK